MCKNIVGCYDVYNRKWIENQTGTLSTNANFTGSGVFLLGIQLNKTEKNKNEGIYVELSPDVTVYAIWYPKEECYIAIRKLTPKECFRLQGWTDDYFEKAQFVNSDSQLYKQAGNGVTVNVVYDIAKRM